MISLSFFIFHFPMHKKWRNPKSVFLFLFYILTGSDSFDINSVFNLISLLASSYVKLRAWLIRARIIFYSKEEDLNEISFYLWVIIFYFARFRKPYYSFMPCQILSEYLATNRPGLVHDFMNLREWFN